MAHGIEVHVVQPSSVPVDRRMRRGKSDGIDEPAIVTRSIARQATRPKIAETADVKTPVQTQPDIVRVPAEAQHQQVPFKAERDTGPNDLTGNEAKEASQHSLPIQPTPAQKPRVASFQAPTTASIQRPASHRFERRPPAQHRYVMMTLRTFEFSDGHRIQRLIPFRGADRSVAYLPEQ